MANTENKPLKLLDIAEEEAKVRKFFDEEMKKASDPLQYRDQGKP